MRLRELRQKRKQALADARAINDAAAAAGRALSDEERSNYEKYMGDFHNLGQDIEREEQLAREELAMASAAEEQVELNTRSGRADASAERAEREVRAFTHFLRTGDASEYRALQVDSNVSGGFLAAPQQMVAGLIQAVDNAVHLRGLATRYMVPRSESLGAVTLDSDPDDPEWTTELKTGNTDDSMAFGKRELRPHPVATKLLVSDTMLRKVPEIESIIRARIAYKMGIKQENAFQNGTGDKQPLGLFTASVQGISTGRDVSTGNTATALTADGLKNARGSLKAQYRNSPSCRWLFNRTTITAISLLKDGAGRYLLTDSIRDDEGEVLLGKRILESEYTPATMTSGLYVGMFADFSHYWIADALDMQIKRLNELYAATDQVGFHVRAETDGMPVLEEAFVRIKMG